MNYNLLFDNNLTSYGILISCGLILGCSLYYLIGSNYITIPSKNVEAFTNEEMEAIINENAVTVINNENIDAIIDSDFDTDVESDHDTIFDYASSSDDESISDDDIADLDSISPVRDFGGLSTRDSRNRWIEPSCTDLSSYVALWGCS